VHGKLLLEEWGEGYAEIRLTDVIVILEQIVQLL
jgi:hypothetical protein